MTVSWRYEWTFVSMEAEGQASRKQKRESVDVKGGRRENDIFPWRLRGRRREKDIIFRGGRGAGVAKKKRNPWRLRGRRRENDIFFRGG